MRIVSVSVGLVVASIAGNAFADPPAPPVQIESIVYGGTACPAGTAYVDISPDGSGFSLGFAEFGVEVGPGLPITASYGSCQASVRVAAAPGYTYAIAGVEYTGYAEIAEGTRGSLRTLVYVQGAGPSSSASTALVGPFNGAFQIENDFYDEQLVWAPCNVARNVNVRSAVSLRRSDADSESHVVIDRATSFRLVWQECSN